MIAPWPAWRCPQQAGALQPTTLKYAFQTLLAQSVIAGYPTVVEWLMTRDLAWRSASLRSPVGKLCLQIGRSSVATALTKGKPYSKGAKGIVKVKRVSLSDDDAVSLPP